MAMWVPNNLAVKGALAAFHDKLDSIPQIWQNHCTQTTSTTATETYSYPGHIPEPRVMVAERHIQGMNDYTFTVTNDTHELTLLVRREQWEDDQVDGVNMRFREMAEVFGTYKDSLFAQLLTDGSSTTLGLAPIDDLAFFHDTRTIGASGEIDNDVTQAAAVGTIPDAAELALEIGIWRAAMRRYNDDQGRPFNTQAMSQIRFIIPPDFEMVYRQVLNSAFFPTEINPSGTVSAGSTDNVFKGMGQIDVLDYLSGTDTDYISLVGGERKPFLYQQRTPLEVIVDTNAANVAERNGVLVMCRERFKMIYGDPRRMLKNVWT